MDFTLPEVFLMIYDLIIIGAGAAGLFAGASLPHPVNGLIIEKKAAPGRKLLLSGSGQCNLTHGGSIKDFISHYGENGSRIRPILYQFNNRSVVDLFENRGIPLLEREDGKIFPKSLKAQDILEVLTSCCRENNLRFLFSSPVDRITRSGPVYTVTCCDRSYQAAKLIIATGGCSYPATGSDGSFFSVLRELRIEIVPPAPALVPLYPSQYPYQELSGISFRQVEAAVRPSSGKFHRNRDDLLLTHTCFSGPVILNLSRYARPGDILTINYYPFKPGEAIIRELTERISGNKKQLITVLQEYFSSGANGAPSELPRRFLEVLCRRAGADAEGKASTTSITTLKALIRLLSNDEFKIARLGGYESAMVTSGGAALSEINTKTMEALKFPNLYFAGEVLDVDGDTGGYNLQFAFSSGKLAAQSAAASNSNP